MWQTLSAWFYTNRYFFLFSGLCALVVATGLPLACYRAPELFTTLTAIAPLAFLATLSTPVALMLLGLMSFATVLAGLTMADVLIIQAMSICSHVYPLLFQKKTQAVDPTEYQLKHTGTTQQTTTPLTALPDIPLSKPRFFFELGEDSEVFSVNHTHPARIE